MPNGKHQTAPISTSSLLTFQASQHVMKLPERNYIKVGINIAEAYFISSRNVKLFEARFFVEFSKNTSIKPRDSIEKKNKCLESEKKETNNEKTSSECNSSIEMYDLVWDVHKLHDHEYKSAVKQRRSWMEQCACFSEIQWNTADQSGRKNYSTWIIYAQTKSHF